MKKLSLILAIVTLMAALAGCATKEVPTVSIAPTQTPEATPTPEPTPTAEPTPEPTAAILNPITGTQMQSADSFIPFACVISNSEEARPQSGISQADVIYEVMTDGGGITRLVAVFGENKPKVVGPMRSGRIHMVNIMGQFPNISVINFGSSEPEGWNYYTQLKKISVAYRADGVSGPHSNEFWRDSSRKAPHNAYCDLTRHLELSALTTYDITTQFFAHDAALLQGPASADTYAINYYHNYTITYEYLKEKNGYRRYIMKDVMLDKENNEEIVVQNVIVQYVPYSYGGPASYAKYESVGEGKADFLINGVYKSGTWKRESYTSMTKYYDAEGNEIKFCPGKIYVDVVDDDKKLEKAQAPSAN